MLKIGELYLEQLDCTVEYVSFQLTGYPTLVPGNQKCFGQELLLRMLWKDYQKRPIVCEFIWTNQITQRSFAFHV